jgi:hypothetical protein
MKMRGVKRESQKKAPKSRKQRTLRKRARSFPKKRMKRSPREEKTNCRVRFCYYAYVFIDRYFTGGWDQEQ